MSNTFLSIWSKVSHFIFSNNSVWKDKTKKTEWTEGCAYSHRRLPVSVFTKMQGVSPSGRCSTWLLFVLRYFPEQVDRASCFEDFGPGSTTAIKWFKLCQYRASFPCLTVRRLLNNLPVSPAHHKTGRSPSQRLTIDCVVHHEAGSVWFLGVWICVCRWGWMCVCVSSQQALFGLCLTSYLLSSPRGALVSVWPCRAILILHTPTQTSLDQRFMITHTYIHKYRSRKRRVLVSICPYHSFLSCLTGRGFFCVMPKTH